MIDTATRDAIRATYRNPFRDTTMRAQYDSARLAFAIRHRDLFVSTTGDRRRPLYRGGGGYGSSFATYFWNGFDGLKKGIGGFSTREDRATIGYAYYRAGADVAKANLYPAIDAQVIA
jgi:hypothetical protein